MTTSRYIFDPQPGTNNFHDILAALVAVFPPLYSLDIIPERLRYMFREETGVTLVATDGGAHKKTDFTFVTIKRTPVPPPADNQIPHFKLSVPAEAVKADDLGWILTFNEDPADLAAAIKAYHDGPLSDEHAQTLMGYLRQYKAERDTFRELRDHDTETFATLNKALDDLGIVVHDTYGEAIKAEVERLRVESSNHAAQAEQYRRERDAALSEVERLRSEIVTIRASAGEF